LKRRTVLFHQAEQPFFGGRPQRFADRSTKANRAATQKLRGSFTQQHKHQLPEENTPVSEIGKWPQRKIFSGRKKIFERPHGDSIRSGPPSAGSGCAY
jgi:hypothetical protein